MRYESAVTGASYDYCYTLEVGSNYFNFNTLEEVKQFRRDYSCGGTLYTPDGYPLQESEGDYGGR